ncbi:uncharacterized protein J3R85_001231 [Psidium guajava]|nr:uncharacterized protein J3R85_001231 [Psidium guajava]
MASQIEELRPTTRNPQFQQRVSNLLAEHTFETIMTSSPEVITARVRNHSSSAMATSS